MAEKATNLENIFTFSSDAVKKLCMDNTVEDITILPDEKGIEVMIKAPKHLIDGYSVYEQDGTLYVTNENYPTLICEGFTQHGNLISCSFDEQNTFFGRCREGCKSDEFAETEIVIRMPASVIIDAKQNSGSLKLGGFTGRIDLKLWGGTATVGCVSELHMMLNEKAEVEVARLEKSFTVHAVGKSVVKLTSEKAASVTAVIADESHLEFHGDADAVNVTAIEDGTATLCGRSKNATLVSMGGVIRFDGEVDMAILIADEDSLIEVRKVSVSLVEHNYYGDIRVFETPKQ
jgi:hypothetical protein